MVELDLHYPRQGACRDYEMKQPVIECDHCRKCANSYGVRTRHLQGFPRKVLILFSSHGNWCTFQTLFAHLQYTIFHSL
jgi:hypothetical protein